MIKFSNLYAIKIAKQGFSFFKEEIGFLRKALFRLRVLKK